MTDRIIIGNFVDEEKIKYKRIPKEEFEELIDSDPCLTWYEDIDENYRKRQVNRKVPAVKVSFVFNYRPEPVFPELHGTFISGKISIKINKLTEQGMNKIKEIEKTIGGSLKYI